MMETDKFFPAVREPRASGFICPAMSARGSRFAPHDRPFCPFICGCVTQFKKSAVKRFFSRFCRLIMSVNIKNYRSASINCVR